MGGGRRPAGRKGSGKEAAMRNAILALVAIGFLAGPWIAPAAAAEKPMTFKGTISEIKDDKVSVKDKDGKKVTFTVDAKTEITIEGKKARLSELFSGMEVTVTPPKGVAQKIEVPKKK
jgi:hypothetical protein